MTTPIAVTIAGSDSSGGAGIQADLKTFSALGVYGASVITALTAQNTKGVTAIHDVPAHFIAAQIDAVFSDLKVNAVKIGMLSVPVAIATVAAGLERWSQTLVVLDPVMIATSGDRLLAPAAIEVLKPARATRPAWPRPRPRPPPRVTTSSTPVAPPPRRPAQRRQTPVVPHHRRHGGGGHAASRRVHRGDHRDRGDADRAFSAVIIADADDLRDVVTFITATDAAAGSDAPDDTETTDGPRCELGRLSSPPGTSPATSRRGDVEIFVLDDGGELVAADATTCEVLLTATP